MTLSRTFMLKLTEQQLTDLAQILVVAYENPRVRAFLLYEYAINEEQIGELAKMLKRRLDAKL